MSGRATFTIVMSSSSMNTPVHTATRVHHLVAMSISSASQEKLIDQLPNHQLLNVYLVYGNGRWTDVQDRQRCLTYMPSRATCSGGRPHVSIASLTRSS